MESNEWDHMEFASWVQGQLRRRQWNAADLARRMGVPNGTISRWMSGERRPSTRSCDLLADVFGADVDMVLTLAGHRPEPVTFKPGDKRCELISMLKRVRLTPDRVSGLEGTLAAWMELDRAVGPRAATNGR